MAKVEVDVKVNPNKEFTLKKVSVEFVTMLVDKYGFYDRENEYNEDELIDCYCEHADGTFTTCYNSNGDCFTDDHETFEDMVKFDSLEEI